MNTFMKKQRRIQRLVQDVVRLNGLGKNMTSKIDKCVDEWAKEHRWNYDVYKEQIEELKKSLRKVIEDKIDVILPLHCIKEEEDPDNCSCIACVRNSFRKELKSRLLGEDKKG